jgi:hypothetical protein
VLQKVTLTTPPKSGNVQLVRSWISLYSQSRRRPDPAPIAPGFVHRQLLPGRFPERKDRDRKIVEVPINMQELAESDSGNAPFTK